MARTFSQLVNPRSIAALEAELDVDEAQYRDMAEEYEQLRDDLKILGARINSQKMVISAVRDALSANGGDCDRGRAPGAVAGMMSKREIAIEVLRHSLRPLFPREVREVAIEKGWLPSDRSAANQLSVAMAKGARSGAFVRDEKGRYGLPQVRDLP
jgi:chromosome segregation ATPase